MQATEREELNRNALIAEHKSHDKDINSVIIRLEITQIEGSRPASFHPSFASLGCGLHRLPSTSPHCNRANSWRIYNTSDTASTSMPLTAPLLQCCRVCSAGKKRWLASAKFRPFCTSGNCPVNGVASCLADQGYINVGCCSGGRGFSVLLTVSRQGVSLLGGKRGELSGFLEGYCGVVDISSERDGCVQSLLCSLFGFNYHYCLIE